MNKLKPCPFCGSEANIIKTPGQGTMKKINGEWEGVRAVVCSNINCSVNMGGFYGKESAVQAWNTRADGWMSVEDRLPRVYQLVLLLTEDDNLYLSYFDTTKWIDSKGQDIDKKYKATHWMSLPEPPESEVNDE